MQEISIKEFSKKTSQYIEEAYAGEEIVVRKYNKPYVKLSRFEAGVEKVLTKGTDNSVKRVVEEEKVRTFLNTHSVLEYGCGCAKEDGKNLCSKHGRI